MTRDETPYASPWAETNPMGCLVIRFGCRELVSG